MAHWQEGVMDSRTASRRKAAGRGAKRLIRADKVAAARRHWKRLLVGYLLIWAIVLPVVVFVPQPAFARGMFVGIGLGVTPVLWREFLLGRGIAIREMGVLAEEWTAAELSQLDSSRWFVLHDLPGPYGNIDHVVIGPTTIHVVETKWTSSPDKPAFLSSAARQAEANLQVIRTHLAAQGVVDRQVHPVLLVWGPGSASIDPEPRQDGETMVVMGPHAQLWRDRIQQIDKGVRPDRVALEAVASPLPAAAGRWSATNAPVPVDPRAGEINGQSQISVAEWKRYGKHRLYANVPDQQDSVGWIDVPSGHLHVEENAPDNTARELVRARHDALAAPSDQPNSSGTPDTKP
jgi:hypothetical protein